MTDIAPTLGETVQAVLAEEKPARKKPGPKPKVANEPAIGRIVRYVTAQGTVRPAIITLVSDVAVDLTVFNSDGAVPVNGVDLDPFEGETPGTYHWPSR